MHKAQASRPSHKAQYISHKEQATRYNPQGTSHKAQATRSKPQGPIHKAQATRPKPQGSRVGQPKKNNIIFKIIFF